MGRCHHVEGRPRYSWFSNTSPFQKRRTRSQASPLPSSPGVLSHSRCHRPPATRTREGVLGGLLPGSGQLGSPCVLVPGWRRVERTLQFLDKGTDHPCRSGRWPVNGPEHSLSSKPLRVVFGPTTGPRAPGVPRDSTSMLRARPSSAAGHRDTAVTDHAVHSAWLPEPRPALNPASGLAREADDPWAWAPPRLWAQDSHSACRGCSWSAE